MSEYSLNPPTWIPYFPSVISHAENLGACKLQTPALISPGSVYLFYEKINDCQLNSLIDVFFFNSNKINISSFLVATQTHAYGFFYGVSISE